MTSRNDACYWWLPRFLSWVDESRSWGVIRTINELVTWHVDISIIYMYIHCTYGGGGEGVQLTIIYLALKFILSREILIYWIQGHKLISWISPMCPISQVNKLALVRKWPWIYFFRYRYENKIYVFSL